MVDLTGVAAALALFLIVVVLFQVAALEKRVARLSGLHQKLDALLAHAGIEYDPYENVPKEVIQAIQRGEKIEAIKHYRVASGVGLKEAKEFVEEIQRQAGMG